MKKKLYYVGVFLSERIYWGLYGFTSYADGYVYAEDISEAGAVAKAFFEKRYPDNTVTGTRPQLPINGAKYARREDILNPQPQKN